MTHSQVWLLLKADSVSAMFHAALVILGAMVLVYNFVIFLLWLFAEGRIKKGVRKANIWMVSLFVFCGLSFSFFPTTTELVKIHVIPVLLSQKSMAEIEKIPPKLLNLLGVGIDTLKDFVKGGKK